MSQGTPTIDACLATPDSHKDARVEALVLQIAEDVARHLEEQSLTNRDVAQRLGRATSYVTDFCSGKRVTLSALSDICWAVGLKLTVTIE